MDLRNFVRLGRKIVAVGRNFREHAAELGNPVPDKPLLFLKPTSSYIEEGCAVEIPPHSTDVHHEVELGVVIGKKCSRVPEESAMDYVGGYALCLDMTARDLQAAAKKSGQPWSVAKGFDTFCPVSKLLTRDQIPDPGHLNLWLEVDGSRRQDGNTKDMIFTVPHLLSYISQIMTLEPGDMVLTGTPEGVGPVLPGQTITAGLNQLVKIKFPVQSRP